jgi:hypothetical protein
MGLLGDKELAPDYRVLVEGSLDTLRLLTGGRKLHRERVADVEFEIPGDVHVDEYASIPEALEPSALDSERDDFVDAGDVCCG